MKYTAYAFIISALFVLSTGCEKEQPPTKSTMEGTWQVVEAYDENDSLITSSIAFPITAFHLSSDNGVVSTAGPMFMYLVYGDNKYTDIASKIDQVFNYASLDFNNGEFFVGGGVQERFTIEMKLEGLPGQKALTDLLDLIGIGQDHLDVVIYHKFLDVKIHFETDEGSGSAWDVMVWEFDEETFAEYNTKDNHGNYVLWEGWPVDNFSKCRFVLHKRAKSLKEVVEEEL